MLENKYILVLVLFLSILIIDETDAQTARLDSLQQFLKLHNTDDTVKVNLLIEIAIEANYLRDFDKARMYAIQACEIADTLNFLKGKTASLNILGKYHGYFDKLLETGYSEGLQTTGKKRQTIIILLLVALVLMFLLVFFLYNSYRLKNKINRLLTNQKHEIERKNEEYLTLKEEYIAIIEELRQSNEQQFIAKNLAKEHENLLIQITDNIPVFISLLNNDLEYLLVNEGYANAFNKSKNEIISRKAEDILDNAAYKMAYQNLNKALNGQSTTFENVHFITDGMQRTVQTTYVPYYFEDEIKGIFVCGVDITKLKQAELAVKTSEERLRILIKNSNDIFVLVNEKGEQYFISDIAQSSTGYTVEELAGPIEDVVHPDDIEIIRQHWERVLTNKAMADSVQYRHKHKEKGYVWFETVAQNFLDNPAIHSIIANVRDISERKKLEQALQKNEIEKERLLSLKLDRIKRELELNQKSVMAASLKLIQNSERDSKTISRLTEIEKHTTAQGKEDIRELISSYKRATLDSNWIEFEIQFQKVHQDFYDKLNKQFPRLTANERKICAFVKLNMSSKDIAQITFQSHDALKKARLRLRQKLGIVRETNLGSFLQNI